MYLNFLNLFYFLVQDWSLYVFLTVSKISDETLDTSNQNLEEIIATLIRVQLSFEVKLIQDVCHSN